MINIFNVDIYKKQLDIDNKKLIKYILDLKKQSQGRKVSSPTGWQSMDLPMKENIFSKLIKEISKNFYKYIDNLSLESEFKIVNMWANVNGYKDYNVIHGHGNVVVSGVYYLKIPKDSGNIFFINPASEAIQITWQKCIKDFTEKNSPFFNINAIESGLILFPGWIKHGVQPNLNKKQDRISLSFNISAI